MKRGLTVDQIGSQTLRLMLPEGAIVVTIHPGLEPLFGCLFSHASIDKLLDRKPHEILEANSILLDLSACFHRRHDETDRILKGAVDQFSKFCSRRYNLHGSLPLCVLFQGATYLVSTVLDLPVTTANRIPPMLLSKFEIAVVLRWHMTCDVGTTWRLEQHLSMIH